jgi:hypothetical protein
VALGQGAQNRAAVNLSLVGLVRPGQLGSSSDSAKVLTQNPLCGKKLIIFGPAQRFGAVAVSVVDTMLALLIKDAQSTPRDNNNNNLHDIVNLLQLISRMCRQCEMLQSAAEAHVEATVERPEKF